MDRPGSGIRRLAGLLLALNLGVLAAGLGFSLWPQKPDVLPELNGDKVRLLAETEEARPAETPPVVQPETAPGGPAPACLSWKGLDAEQYLTVEAHLRRHGVPEAGYELNPVGHLGWWVYLPPLRNAEALRAALEDLRQKGVRDMAPLRGGKLANAVSLGAFPTQRKAREHAARLEARGVVGVRFGLRPEAGEVRLTLSGKLPAGQVEALARDWPEGLQPAVCAAP